MSRRFHHLLSITKKDDGQNMNTYEDLMQKIEELRDQQKMNLGIILDRLEQIEVALAPTSTEESEAGFFTHVISGSENEEASQQVNLRAGLRTAKKLGFSGERSDDELAECVRLAERITSNSRARTHNRDADCRLPVKSQATAWFILNYEEVKGHDFEPSDILEALIDIAATQTTQINFRREEHDTDACRWFDIAWKNTEKTSKTDVYEYEGFPF
jgi:hypothetical protein